MTWLPRGSITATLTMGRPSTTAASVAGEGRPVGNAEVHHGIRCRPKYIDWYSNRRLHGAFRHVSPNADEALHAMTQTVTAPLKIS